MSAGEYPQARLAFQELIGEYELKAGNFTSLLGGAKNQLEKIEEYSKNK